MRKPTRRSLALQVARTLDRGAPLPDVEPFPLRWRVAGFLRRHLPPLKGRTRLTRAVLGRPTGRAVVRFGPDLRFEVDLSDQEQRAVLFFPFELPALAPLLDAVLSPGDVFADVGANIGVYSCWAARRVGVNGEVHSFEPVEATHQVLRANVAAHGLTEQVSLVAAAVGDSNGEVTLYTVPGASGWASAGRGDLPGVVAESVPVITLDEYFEGRRPPRLLKIDVEGFEPHVVSGMAKLLAGEQVPILALELSETLLQRSGSSGRELIESLRALGLEVWEVTPAGVVALRPGTRERNIVALHPGQHAHELDVLLRTKFPYDWST